MIRLHVVMILALGQAIFSERLLVTLNTGGQGVIPIMNLCEPWVSLFLVVIPFRAEVKKALWTRTFVIYWLPFLGLTFLLPILGVVLVAFPVRTLFASWNGLVPLTFLALGCAGAGVARAPEAAKVVRGYFLFAVLAQLILSTIQTLGQLHALPGFLAFIDSWDFRFKLLYLPDNIILGRATGFYLNPNSLGIWALLALWTSFFLLKGWQRGVGIAASFVTVLLSQSRGTLAALLGSAAIYGLLWMFLWANRQQRLKATLLMVVCVLPIVALTIPGAADSLLKPLKGVTVVERAIERYTSGAKVLSQGAAADANFQGRTEYWDAAYAYLAQHPFGSLGSPQMVINLPPDNQFIAVLEQGSFYFFVALLLAFLRGIALIREAEGHERLLAVASIALVINGVSAVPFAYAASYLYWLLVGVYLAGRVQDLGGAPVSVALPGGWRALRAGTLARSEQREG